MIIRGWVYVITNRAMPGLVKVGFTTKDPLLRAAELGHTGSPHPYKVVYDVLVEAPRDLEQQVHALLRDYREGKEWFRCSIGDATDAIRSLTSNKALLENVKGYQESERSTRRNNGIPLAVRCTFKGCKKNALTMADGSNLGYCLEHYKKVVLHD